MDLINFFHSRATELSYKFISNDGTPSI